ncbi:class I SAM-dependent methyltransferase [Amycolatopsis cihanbeyliensis]|uniref:Putative methyltransferase n=1 Tax=Amycolatopsis cihanbeyliensis TaxID=1128664 RepID=A0A542DRL6_AMYCI|nr:class I SAM-dependent methyltransferase [Amycolatopsis cihanbeyliensis]TQJ05749.1 putative methyltransferase [Amycolatopsis cihanbeyliensis]
MRRIVGKQVLELAATEFDELLAAHRGAVLDVGTGDGKHAQYVAQRNPELLVIGLDAAKDGMREISAKAASRKRGLANLVYVWASAEGLPAELHGITDLRILMPWGSLLRGVLGSDPDMLRGLAAVCAPGATMLITLNLHAWRPPVPEVGDRPEPTPDSAADMLAGIYTEVGWRLDEARYFGQEEVRALATSWTRRLNSSRSRLDVLGLTATLVQRSGDRSTSSCTNS